MNWTDGATRALINIWGEDNIQQGLDGTRRNASTYAEIAKKLKECGYDFTSKQIINKCKNLRRQYTAAKDANNKSGNPPSEWVYFEEMDKIFGERPVSRPIHILDGMDASTFQDENEPSVSDESSVLDGAGNETAEEDNRLTTVNYPLLQNKPRELSG
ncbi:trihelix transcription factor ASIL1-like, partial [Anneissia japonica]|uniref:trihelix transcription factor ASIL1-like n=1 Tax=Anneissia japonica TaxID=1529436 RepID=UPI0014257A48